MDSINDKKWVEIDVEAIKHNFQVITEELAEEVHLIAVLKNNAYGHGAIDIARILNQNGVDYFAVTYLDEALSLRRAGIKSSILLFSPIINESELKEAIENEITLVITSLYDANLIDKVSRQLRLLVNFHLKIDTGLGRFGIPEDDLLEVVNIFADNPYILIEGIFTHMADASNEKYTLKQFQKFLEVIAYLEDNNIFIPIKHCANSTVFLKYPEMHLDAVRIGTLLAGHYPVGKMPHPFTLFEPFTFKTRVIAVNNLKKGDYLGYFRTYRLKKEAKVAVIPVGFSDGLFLEVANPPLNFLDLLKILARISLRYFNFSRFTTKVKIKGKLYPIRGKVFMQMALVEIPSHIDIKVGDVVEVPLRKTLVANNIKYVYVKDGLPGKIREEDKTVYITE